MRKLLQTRWTEIGDKLVALADEFPAEHYDFRPTPDTRSFAEQLRHVAFWNQYLLATLRGEAADGDANELDPTTFRAKPEIGEALRASVAAVGRAIGSGKGDLDEASAGSIVAFIEHNGEHYGQLALIFRLRGLVPPASR